MIEVYDDQTCALIKVRGLRKQTPELMQRLVENERRATEEYKITMEWSDTLNRRP
jgi:hypothetical protein